MKHIARLYRKTNDRALTGGLFTVSLLLLITLLLFPANRTAAAKDARNAERGRYVVSLISNTKPINTSSLRRREAFAGHTLYTTKARIKGVLWYRLRLGFFPTRKAAEKEMRLLKGSFKEAWVAKVSVRERDRAHTTALPGVSPAPSLDETGKKISEWSKKTYSKVDKSVRHKIDDIKAKLKESKEKREKEKAAKEKTMKAEAAEKAAAQKTAKKTRSKKTGKQKSIFGSKKKARENYKKAPVEPGRYVVSLISNTKPIKTSKLRSNKAFKGHTLYTTSFRKDGVLWHRLRLGFFPTKKAAEQEMRLLKGSYQDAWVARVTVKERARVSAAYGKSARRTATANKKVKGKKTAKAKEREKISIQQTGKKFTDWSKKKYTGFGTSLKGKLAEMEKNFHESTARPLEGEEQTGPVKQEERRTITIKRKETFKFNHFKTGFPLENAHKAVKCEFCHARGIFKNTPSECAQCHTQGSMVKATVKSADHTKTNAPCEDCHSTTTTDWTLSRFRHTAETFGRCLSCHDGIRNTGKTASHLASSNNCEDCHSTSSWTTARFDHSGISSPCANCHNGTKATGKHASHVVSSNLCDDCHSTGGWIPASFDHSTITAPCSSCHNGTTATGKSGGHIPSSNTCDECHTTKAWIPTSFDHSNISSPCATCHNGTQATGKPAGHVQSNNICDNCHSTSGWIPAGFDHTGISSPCANCHNGTTATGKNPEHVQSSNTCDDCHSTNAWVPASFNHSGISSPCANCHNGTTATGKNPEHVQSSNLCDNCHSTSAWLPANVNHSGITGPCFSCHNGTTATGKPGGHVQSS
ncbi:MAG: SPOR domain-containing protein, partial [Thermodesulfobacteriota bacterium]